MFYTSTYYTTEVYFPLRKTELGSKFCGEFAKWLTNKLNLLIHMNESIFIDSEIHDSYSGIITFRKLLNAMNVLINLAENTLDKNGPVPFLHGFQSMYVYLYQFQTCCRQPKTCDGEWPHIMKLVEREVGGSERPHMFHARPWYYCELGK